MRPERSAACSSAAPKRRAIRPSDPSRGLILALARGIPPEDRALRAGRWQTGLGFGLKEKTLGVLGIGRLGAELARIGVVLGMEVIAWSQNLTAERAASVGARWVDKPTLFEASDDLTIHLVLSDRTGGLVGSAELAVNTLRAGIVDTDALVLALQRGTIAGAGLDLYDVEPLPLPPSSRRPTRSSPPTWGTSRARATGPISGRHWRTSKPG